MKIIVAADHRGRVAAIAVAERLEELGHSVSVSVPEEHALADYPEIAQCAAREVAGGGADRAVLICGTGIGMAIAANKVRGVRAASIHDEITAELSRAHLDANICCFSADLLGLRLIEKLVELWINEPFEGGRHQRRVDQITASELPSTP